MKKRFFCSKTENRASGAMHAIGNGEIMLYGQGPEWTQVFGAPYSCPTVFSLTVSEKQGIESYSVRREKASSYEHRFSFGVITDCADVKYKCIARHWNLQESLHFVLKSAYSLQESPSFFQDNEMTFIITVPSNATVFSDYPVCRNTCMMLSLKGSYLCEKTNEGIILTLFEEGTMYVTGAESFPDCSEQMKMARQMPFEEILSDAERKDKLFLEECEKNRSPLRESKYKERVSEAIEDVLFLIYAQQHKDGGVQAGHNYHLAYVRDQYGVSRGLLSMGAYSMAKSILEFYRKIFSAHGFIANAQGMGVDGMFHVHENDLTEITGYLLLQATDYFQATGDSEFFCTLIPMCNWALKAQISCLHNYMLPFNGDETYVAGGIVPRTILNHGSFEATLMFIIGGRRYLKACRNNNKYEEYMEEASALIEDTFLHFDENFRRKDKYVANSIKRTKELIEPEYRHGVCYHGDAFEWLKRKNEGCYVCPKCINSKDLVPCREEFQLKSTLLMSSFINADILSEEIFKNEVCEYLNEYKNTGKLPSRSDGERSLGYDYGFLLFGAAKASLEADELLEKMLSLQDECGAWCEYYNNSLPSGTLCRPWESAINIASAINYLTK